jgi:H2-forming N5,N10-methylenetetrahydromethanopterin dehydrogenase-like enzyme
VLVCGYVDEFEVEEEDGGDPPVDGSVRLHVRVTEHTFDITGVDFDDEIADADKVEAHGLERTEETIEFEFCLRVTRLAFVL